MKVCHFMNYTFYWSWFISLAHVPHIILRSIHFYSKHLVPKSSALQCLQSSIKYRKMFSTRNIIFYGLTHEFILLYDRKYNSTLITLKLKLFSLSLYNIYFSFSYKNMCVTIKRIVLHFWIKIIYYINFNYFTAFN